METIFFQCAGDTILPVNQPRLTHENNLTTSELEYTPKIKDHGKILSCTATNGVFPKQNQSVELNVYYIPVVHIEILSEIDPSNIREGDNLILKCNIQVGECGSILQGCCSPCIPDICTL